MTVTGWAVLGGLALTSLSGLDTENTVAYQAFVPLLFLVLVSAPFLLFFRARFSAKRFLPRLGTVGTSLTYRVLVRNLTSKTQRGLTMLEDVPERQPTYGEWLAARRARGKRFRSFRLSRHRRTHPGRAVRVKEGEVPQIPPHQEAEIRIELTPLRRGILNLSGLTLARPDPLGLFRSLARLRVPQSMLVLPKRYPLPPIALPGRTKYQQGGVTFAADVGQSEEFVALRDYRRGDPLRHIHWRSWAKAGRPIVKEFEDEFFVRHALLLDTFIDDPQSELFEEAVSVAASFASAVLTQESLLDLLFVGTQAYCFTAGRGLAHTDQILEVLASVQTCGDRPFRALENLVLDHAAQLSGCICVLLAWDEPRQALVRKLKALQVPLLVVVLVEPGETRALDAGPLRGEPEQFHVLPIDGVERGLARLA